MKNVVDDTYLLTGKYLDGCITSVELRQLENLLAMHEESRIAFSNEVRLVAELGAIVEGSVATVRKTHRDQTPETNGRLLFRVVYTGLALAASIAIIAMVWMGDKGETRRSHNGQDRGEVVAKITGVAGAECWLVHPSLGEGGMLTEEARDTGTKVAIKVGDDVFAGDRVETGEKGKIVLVWVGEKTRLELGAGSELSIPCSRQTPPEASQLGGRAQSETSCFGWYSLKLEKGMLIAKVAKQSAKQPFVIETPHALVTVLGTRFSVKIEGTKNQEPSTKNHEQVATCLQVEEGLVKFTRLADGKAIEVAAGQFAVAGETGEDFALRAYEVGNEWGSGGVIYEDDFDGVTLDSFWEKVTPASQVKVNPSNSRSALVLSIGGKGVRPRGREALASEVNVISRPIALSTDVLVMLVVAKKVNAFSVDASDVCFQGVDLLDNLGRAIVAQPLGEKSLAKVNDLTMDPTSGSSSYYKFVMSPVETVYFFCVYPSGKVFFRQDEFSIWYQAILGKSLKLGLRLSSEGSLIRATWPIDRVVVRRLKDLPEESVDRLFNEMFNE